MNSLFGRKFWIIRLLGIATASAMAGSAASSALAFTIVDASSSFFGAAADDGEVDPDDELDEPDVPTVLANGPTASQTRARGSVARSSAIAKLDKRNPFCPTCVPETGVVVMADGPMPSATGALPPSKLPLRLQATMEAENPAQSLATIYDVERNIVGIYGRGDVIRPGVILASVDLGAVQLQRGTGFERLELGAVVEPPAPPPTEGKAKPAKDDAPAESTAISCATDDNCTVERAFVEEVLANPAKLASQAPRISPAPGGGYKVSGVKKNSFVSQLGVKSGDVILAVNGESLVGLDQVMGLVTKLSRATNISVTIERKGKPIEKQIEIR
jgi:general secretion pathway protein C